MPIYTIQTPSGHTLDIDAASEDAALEGARLWHAQNLASKTDDELRAMHMSDKDLQAAYAAHSASGKSETSLAGAIGQGVADVAQGVGRTIKDYLNPEAGKTILDSDIAKNNPRYKSASEEFMRPEDGAENHTLGLDWSALPRAALEQAPGLALDLGVQALVPKWAGPVGRYVANAATYGLRTAGNETENRAAARTGDGNAEPTAEDKLAGLGSTAAQVALGQIGLNKIISPARVTATGIKGAAQAAANVGKAALTQGAVGAGQDLISQGVTKAGTDQSIDAQEALASGVMSGVNGGVFATPKGLKDASIATRFGNQSADEHTNMAANRILAKVQSPGELSNPETAYKATSGAVSDVSRELGEAAKRVTNPSTEADNAIQRARDGEALTKKDLAAIDAEGNDQLSSLVRQATALSKLTDMGRFDEHAGTFSGGAHQAAKKLIWPMVKEAGKFGAMAGVLNGGGVSLDTIASHIPGALEGAAAGYAAIEGSRLSTRPQVQPHQRRPLLRSSETAQATCVSLSSLTKTRPGRRLRLRTASRRHSLGDPSLILCRASSLTL